MCAEEPGVGPCLGPAYPDHVMLLFERRGLEYFAPVNSVLALANGELIELDVPVTHVRADRRRWFWARRPKPQGPSASPLPVPDSGIQLRIRLVQRPNDPNVVRLSSPTKMKHNNWALPRSSRKYFNKMHISMQVQLQNEEIFFRMEEYFFSVQATYKKFNRNHK